MIIEIPKYYKGFKIEIGTFMRVSRDNSGKLLSRSPETIKIVDREGYEETFFNWEVAKAVIDNITDAEYAKPLHTITYGRR